MARYKINVQKELKDITEAQQLSQDLQTLCDGLTTEQLKKIAITVKNPLRLKIALAYL